MALLTWTPDWSVGVHQLDEDHKKLVAMINELHQGMLEGRGDALVGTILQRLVSYTVEHFRHEEDYFAQTHYPGTAAHKREHDALKKTVMLEVQKFCAGGSGGLSMETLAFLRDWLRTHIQDCDKAYAAHLNAHGVH